MHFKVDTLYGIIAQTNPLDKSNLDINEHFNLKWSEGSKIDFMYYLRVLLAKWPDICKPTFSAHYLFGCIIKSTHLGDVPKAKSWDLGAYTVPWGVI